jgi:hypothetical protein
MLLLSPVRPGVYKDFVKILGIFAILPKPFSRFRSLIARPTHDRLTTLRQVSRIPPQRETGRREDLARLLVYFQAHSRRLNFQRRRISPGATRIRS